MGIRIVDLTPEMREKLNGFMPIPITNTFEYVPAAFRELSREQQPVFKLKYLDGITLARSQDMLYGRVSNDGGKPELSVRRGEFIVYVCQKGIVGWDNYFDCAFKDVSSIGMLPPDLLSELCDAITERKTLSDEERLGLK